MFDKVDDLKPDQLVSEIESAHRMESVSTARKLALIAALLRHRMAAEREDSDLQFNTVDGYEQTFAEVGALLNMSPTAASYQVHYAEVLDTRLPRIGALLAEGKIDWRTVQLIISRTDLVLDAELVARLDETLADRVGRWHSWSRQRIINAADALVLQADPDAARERRRRDDEGRYIGITAQPNGMAELWGMVNGAHATAFDKKLSHLAKDVCARDPRTMEQRRADALGALTEGRRLSCTCGKPDCANRTDATTPSNTGTQVVINVVATADTISGQSERPGFVDGYGVIDAELVRQLAADAPHRLLDGTSITQIEALHYQPSAALQRLIRCRDLTCRFPGCSRPAEVCDIDHTVPFNHADPAAGGLTVPCNLKCLCRQHNRHSPSDDFAEEEDYAMTTRKPRIDRTAIASLAAALVGVIAWPFLGGWAALLAATLSLVFGFLALSRIKRNGHTGRWLAVGGIGLGAVFYVFLIVTIARDIIDPVQLQR